IADLIAAAKSPPRRRFFEAESSRPLVGARIDTRDPLAVLEHGKTGGDAAVPAAANPGVFDPAGPEAVGPDGTAAVRAPMQGTIVLVEVNEGEAVTSDQQLIVIEAMKMEHVIAAPLSGIVRTIAVAAGDTVPEGCALLFIEPAEVDSTSAAKS